MTASNFAPSERLVVQLEGGYSNNPKDPGGATMCGVTQRAWEDYRGSSCTVAQLKALTPAEVSEFYEKLYWPSVDGDALPSGVDLMLFDGAVNVGRGRSVTFLQQSLGVSADGTLGPVTLAATLKVRDVGQLIADIATRRRAFYHALPTFGAFGNGWNRRVTTVALTASSWAARGRQTQGRASG